MYEPSLTDRVTGSAMLARREKLGRGIGHALGRLDVLGLENVPRGGPLVVAGNHLSFWDGPLIFAHFPRPVTFLVKSEMFIGPVAPVLRSAGQVAIVRGRVDRAPIRLALEVLAGGGVVGIFPEGSRGDGLASTAKPGVGYLALRSGASVVPVACHGTDAMEHRRTFGRPAARMVFGPPIPVERAADHQPLNRRAVARTTEQIRAALAALVSASAPGTAQREAA
jgi:1-acyl-sn-glycerol-3-phosphate acyltransferase